MIQKNFRDFAGKNIAHLVFAGYTKEESEWKIFPKDGNVHGMAFA